MMTISSVCRSQAADERLKGNVNGLSRDEMSLYDDIYASIMQQPETPYVFYFNERIVNFGVPSKSFKIHNEQEAYIEFAMTRCGISRAEAIELLCKISTDPVRTNTLMLDVGKVCDGKLIMALELNRSQHYNIPDDTTKLPIFARDLFCDMVKERELRKVGAFAAIDFSRRANGTADTEEMLATNKLLYRFVHEL